MMCEGVVAAQPLREPIPDLVPLALIQRISVSGCGRRAVVWTIHTFEIGRKGRVFENNRVHDLYAFQGHARV
jgi:hypothetical protein